MDNKYQPHSAASLAQSVGFEILGDALGHDVESALSAAGSGGAVFPGNPKPLSIFQDSLAASIRKIEADPREDIFQKFLLKGPYHAEGPIPADSVSNFLSDDDVAIVIRFIFAHMVNCFKGALAEMLATAPCLRLLQHLKRTKILPRNAGLFVGDAVGTIRTGKMSRKKGADLHMLIEYTDKEGFSHITVAGVAEVKSYAESKERLSSQITGHLSYAKQGIWINGTMFSAKRVTIGFGPKRRVVRIVVLPAAWKLPRTFHFRTRRGRRCLHVQPHSAKAFRDQVIEVGTNQWEITLKWSMEALTAAAYAMTFWYMEKVGEIIYAKGVPKDWSEMSPAEAGQNAAKMMLYYAILRSRTASENQRAIALYNCYGFGYALGMSFRNAKRSRQMLWPEHLDEVLASGKTKCGCRFFL